MTIKKLLYAFILPLLLFAGQSFAQERTVNGRVVDSSGNGIANATVLIKGTNAGTQTAQDGAFSLRNVPASATTLTISSVGYGARDVTIGSGEVVVTLTGTAASLSEVVVVGYGTQRKRDLTGSVAIINSKDFQKGNITTPEQMIAGKVPGVSIISNGGQPGSGSTIRVRGGTSLNASNDPLIVIDGVPVAQGGIQGALNPLSFINPNDIESFTILKDASSAAIYGTRAANGVILITTKKGRGGALRASFSTTTSVSTIAKKLDLLNGAQVRNIVNELGNSARIAQLGDANTDWQNEIYQSAMSTDNNLSLTGGIKGLPYRFSVGYQLQNGILRTDRFQRTSVALNLSPSFLDNHLKVDLNLKGSMQKNRLANTGAIGAAASFDPTQPVYASDKRYGGFFEWRESDGSLMLNAGRNPLGLLNQTENTQAPMRSIGNVQFDYKFHFLPDLRANLNLGYDVSKNTGTYFVSDSAAQEYLTGGRRNPERQSNTNTLLDFYLNYVKDITSIKSRLDLTAGYSFNNFQTKSYFFPAFNVKGDTIPGSKPNFAFDIPENTLISYFSRLNFSINDKYLFTATIRRDGSSRFSQENRWGTFPSMAFAWRIKGEDFLKNNTAISDLKLRMGYGVTGQQEGIGNYQYIPSYVYGGPTQAYPFGGDTVQSAFPIGYNSALKWEETSTYNVALDYAFGNGRVNGMIEVYMKKTKDLLNRVPLAAGSTFGLYQLSNVGSMENKGIEFNINYQAVRNRSVTWDLNFNATYNKNTITNLTVRPNDPTYKGLPSGGAEGANGFIYLNAVGGPRNTFYLYQQVYDMNGKPIEGLFEDVNRDGIINAEDKVKGQASDPNVFLGFSTNLTYKNWNAGFVMRAHFNNYMYNNVYSNRGRLNQVLGAYTTGNASVNYLETGFGGNVDIQNLSDYYVENASFLRMDNINFGYNFGKVFNQKATLRVNAFIQNVFIVTKYKGLDPENSGGIDNTLYPRPRIFSLGINMDF